MSEKKWMPPEEYKKTLPRKRAAAGVLFFNSKGELLLVKPTYRDYWKAVWKIVGGSVDAFESPKKTCVREVKEELGLDMKNPRFLGVAYKKERKKNDEVFVFYFYGGILSDARIKSIVLHADELSEFKFFPFERALEVISSGNIKTFPYCLDAIRTGKAFYIER